MKQTAVEWLFLMMNNPNRDQVFSKKLLDMAKEIEKQQIYDAWNIRAREEYPITFTDKRTAEQYYKETYKNSQIDIEDEWLTRGY